MNFKKWLLAELGLASFGGGLPSSGYISDGGNNTTLNVASKFQTGDGQNKHKDPDEEIPDPDKAFGYKGRPKDKKKRLGAIDKRNRNIRPKRTDVSDMA